MTQTESQNKPPFTCKSATFYFTYSFMLSRRKEGKGKGKEPVDPREVFDRASRERIKSLRFRASDGSGLPVNRLGIAPHLSLASNSGWIEYEARDATLNEHPLKVSSMLRLFSTGGTYTFALRLLPDERGKRFTTEDLLNFLKLTRRKSSGEEKPAKLDFIYKGSSASTSLYESFEHRVQEYCAAASVNWLDTDTEEKLIDINALDAQNPWVVTVAEVEGEVADTFCCPGEQGVDPAESKMLKIRRYQEEIAQIVFRSVAERLVLEPAYLQPPTARGVPGIFNINIDARLFVCMSRRSILCICENPDQDPASYFVPTLLDICETVRARWHALVIINKMMDRAMCDFANLSRTTPLQRRQLLKSVRMMLANSLEDPTMYIVAGDALSKILDDLTKMFRLEELCGALLGKMSLIDKIYSDARGLDWLQKEMEQDEKENREAGI